MIDTDGNGLLSWEECHDIVQSTLKIFRQRDAQEDKFMDILCKFFTDFIFLVCGYDISVFKDFGARD